MVGGWGAIAVGCVVHCGNEQREETSVALEAICHYFQTYIAAGGFKNERVFVDSDSEEQAEVMLTGPSQGRESRCLEAIIAAARWLSMRLSVSSIELRGRSDFTSPNFGITKNCIHWCSQRLPWVPSYERFGHSPPSNISRNE